MNLYLLLLSSLTMVYKTYAQVDVKSFFVSCDIDHNQYLSQEELSTCYKDLGTLKANDITEIFTLFDQDKDSLISIQEYTDKVETLQSSTSHDIEYTSHDGTKKTISMEELNRRLQDPMDHGLKYEGGRLLQEKSGTTDLDTLSRTNPQLAQVITMAKWCQDQLIVLGYGHGKLSNIQSPEDRPSKHERNGDFDTWLRISILNEKTGVTGIYELQVQRNKQLYVKPHLALLDAFYIKDDGSKVALPFPQPRTRFVSADIWTTGVKIAAGGVCFLLFLMLILRKG